MPAVNLCPEPDAYQRLIHGELPPSDVERLSQHLDACSSCVAAVQTLLGEDTLLSALRGAPVDAPTGAEVPADLKRRLLALRSASDPSLTLQALNPPHSPDEIGRLAHYRLLKVLGEGGMGVVFLAEDTLLVRSVALKIMKPEIAADPRHRQRFLREARAAAKVEHDHIVPIYGVGEDGGMPWLAMPFLKGQSLDELLKRVKVLKPDQAVRLGAQVAKGLAAAHAAGLIHRDVKPANIWVEPEDGGRAKLLDFGLARDQSPPPDHSPQREGGDEHLTRTGAVVGTPAFMAPEQANSEPLDARADLFSLGCVLYRMLTGRLPFQGQGMMDTLRALATETPPHPHEVNPAVARPLSALIMGLLAKDRSARPASASVVAAALAAMQEKPTHSAQQPLDVTERQEEGDHWADWRDAAERRAPVAAPRRRWYLATAAAVLLALGGTLAAGIVVIIKNREGKEMARVTVPDGTSAEIKLDGGGKATVDRVGFKPDRRAAEWVLSIDGTIKVRQGLQERDIQAAKDLPTDSFKMVSVDLHGNQKVDDAGLEHLKELTNLKELSLGGTRISNTGLEQLKGLTSLSVLSLGGTGVSDAGLVHLSGLSNLTMLRLNYTQVRDAALVRLKKLLNLTLLDLTGTQVSDDGLVQLKGLLNLTSLALSDTQVGNDGLEHLKGLTNLTVLVLNGTRVSDDGLVHLKGLTNLKGLILSGTRVSDDGLIHLKRLTQLTGLNLDGTRVSDAGLAHLKGLTNLTSLGLSCEQVRDAGLEHLVGLTNLTELWLDGTRVSGAGLVHLKGLTQLRGLSLTGVQQVSDDGLVHLKGLTNLTGLELSGTRVSDAGLAHLKGLTKLTVLGLIGTRVSDGGLKHLAGLSNLTHLDLTGTQVTANGIASLQKALPKCKIISGPAQDP